MPDNSSKVTDISITVLFAALLLPLALDQFFGTNTTAWSTTAQTVWDFLPVGGLIGLLVLFLDYRKRRSS